MKQEIVMLVGSPASGKTSIGQEYIDKGYLHLNRDKMGGKIIQLVAPMKDALLAGKSVLLDNTFGTTESRKPFIQAAKEHKVSIVCKHMNTSIEDAQFNAAKRIIERKGKLLGPDELKADKDPNMFPVTVLFAYQKAFEPPTKNEGFDEVDIHKFTRRKEPGFNGKALLLDYDDTLRKTKSGIQYPLESSDVEILPGRKEVLQQYKDQGYLLLGVSNQSGVAKGKLSNGAAKACFDKTNELLGFDIDYAYCPHGSFPIACYCRKPLPGHFVQFMLKYKLDQDKCLFVGDLTSDKTFAKRSGIRFVHANEFFK